MRPGALQGFNRAIGVQPNHGNPQSCLCFKSAAMGSNLYQIYQICCRMNGLEEYLCTCFI